MSHTLAGMAGRFLARLLLDTGGQRSAIGGARRQGGSKMTSLHMRPRWNLRISALGLVLSFGLIFGASGIIRLNAAEKEQAAADVEHSCEPVGSLQSVESTTPSVLSRGHLQDERNL